jgi:hypothetical protein
MKEIRGRLDLLLGIGLDYLNFNRRSGTLSGGESQRIRLSTQIGSGLMGMLYARRAQHRPAPEGQHQDTRRSRARATSATR